MIKYILVIKSTYISVIVISIAKSFTYMQQNPCLQERRKVQCRYLS